jgi:hypothetical protein
MEDDYQLTLKGKIKILYQLEKWQDVSKLCEQYNEKYGKDVEIDMMRFKSDRRLNKNAPAEEKKARISTPGSQARKSPESLAGPEIEAEGEQPLLLTADNEAVQNPAMLVTNEIPAAEQPQHVEEKLEYDPFPQANELIITDPFAENEPGFSLAFNEPPPDANALLITDSFAENKPADSQVNNEQPPAANALLITDPFAENEPIFSLAHNEPPVILTDSGEAENAPIQIEPRAEEMAIAEENPDELDSTKIAFDFKSNPAMAFDAEPTLAAAPQGESIAMPKNAEEKKLPAEFLAADSVIIDKSAEVWHEISAAAGKERDDEKPQSLSEPASQYEKKIKSPRKIAFNFKYFLVLILPLAAAVILWLALSGKINLDGGAAAKVSLVSVVEPPVPAVQKPTLKGPPVAQVIPKTDEKDQLVNAKILQAKNLIKNGDIINALAVVLEAKKIKMTEPLRQLEELITKKIREDESRAAEQKQAEQNKVQSEDQFYAKAETEDTLEAWKNFLLLYPQGEFTARARNKILALEKKAVQKAEQELQLKIKQMQKLKLRFEYMNLSQAEVNTAVQQLGKPIVHFEQLEHGGEKVVIDFSSGLMWILWKKPMVFDKAKWWANRIYAGYSGWRLPTVEESLSLLQIDPSLYAGLMDFAVWTGDMVSDQSHAIWVLRLPQGRFIPEDFSQVYYVWAVRKAGK